MATDLIKSDNALVNKNSKYAVTSKSLAGLIEQAARKKISNSNDTTKSVCDVIEDLPEFKDTFKYLPVYISGSNQPFRMSSLAYNQLKGKLELTTEKMTDFWSNTLLKEYPKLTNLESVNASSIALAYLSSTTKKEAKELRFNDSDITIELSEIDYDKTKTYNGVINTDSKTIVLQNIQFNYRIIDNEASKKGITASPWGKATLSEITIHYDNFSADDGIDEDGPIDLALNNHYTVEELSLSPTVTGTLSLSPISYAVPSLMEGYVETYLSSKGIEFYKTHYTASRIQINLLNNHSGVEGAASMNITMRPLVRYFATNEGNTVEESSLTFEVLSTQQSGTNSVPSSYNISFSMRIITIIEKALFGNNLFKKRFNFNTNFIIEFIALDHMLGFSDRTSSEKNAPARDFTIGVKDINFFNFILSLKALYTFLGLSCPKIFSILFPSSTNKTINISYNQTTETISQLKLYKSENTSSFKTTPKSEQFKITPELEQFNRDMTLAYAPYLDEEDLKVVKTLYTSLYDFYNVCRETFFKSYMGALTVDDTSIKSEVSRNEVIKQLNCADNYKAKLGSLDYDSPEYTAAYTAYEEAYNLEHPEVVQEKKQKAVADAEKMEKLSQARNKVDTLQYQTVMQNPATTFSSRMEQLDVTGSYDVNKMEHNEYEYEGTLCIKEKIDSPASIRIYSENKESAGPARTIEAIYVDCFLLQGVQEVDEEKYSIFQSLDGDTLVQFFGRRPTTLNLSGILYDTKNQQWYNDFKYWYDNYLRGSAALKNDSRIVLVYTDQIIEGFILSMSMQKQATMNVSVTVNFTMLVVSHTQLATEWTDPEHSEHIRGDRHCGHMIDEAYAEHEKNKAKLDSLSGLNFELLADASPDKANYYDNYLKSNTKLGAALEYSSGSSLSSIAFSSKLADVKLNMGVSEVSSDVIAVANSNQSAGLALGSSGISMDSLKLKLNNAEDYARSYRTSQEKSTMDQINFRLSKS